MTMDASPLSMPLYSPFLPLKRGGVSTHTMAHVAAAALTIILDLARSLDDAMNAGTTNNSVELQQHLEEMKTVATMCSEVLQLASHEANNDNGGERGTDSTTSNHFLAQNLLVGTIPRISPHRTIHTSCTSTIGLFRHSASEARQCITASLFSTMSFGYVSGIYSTRIM